jgi:hypothetical protein
VSDTATVAVEFVDSATGECFARSDIPAPRLPATFLVDTTLSLAGEPWSVVRAEPPTAAEFRASGRLVLTLSRVTSVSPDDILYSLPTLCDRLPALAPASADLDPLQLHEEDWRQVELVSAGLVDVVQTELAAIQHVHQENAVTAPDGSLVGFRRLHVRTAPAVPLSPPLPEARLWELLPVHRTYPGVGFASTPGIATDSFAYASGPINVYGLRAGGHVGVLGFQVTGSGSEAVADAAAGLAGLMRAFSLVLVDWCRCAIVGPDAVGGYLQATG